MGKTAVLRTAPRMSMRHRTKTPGGINFQRNTEASNWTTRGALLGIIWLWVSFIFDFCLSLGDFAIFILHSAGSVEKHFSFLRIENYASTTEHITRI